MGSRNILQSWLLPLSLALGIGIYLVLHFVPGLDDTAYLGVARWLQPAVVGLMLFIQLNVVSPSDLHWRRWHWWLLTYQTLMLAALVYVATVMEPGGRRILLECAILCAICPTAAAASVITPKIGGDLAGVVTYIVISDALACVLIPLMIPIVHPEAGVTFMAAFWAVAKKVFSILALPCLLAWLIRYTLPGVQEWLARRVGAAFYVWCLSLTLAMSLATSTLVESGVGIWVALGIAAVSLIFCVGQYGLGRLFTRAHGMGTADRASEAGDAVTGGQALGQKNTGFIIWLGYNFMTPVSSVAGGLYAIWQNLINSWELARKGKQSQTTA